jgi:hypothetical protein
MAALAAVSLGACTAGDTNGVADVFVGDAR